MNSVFKNPTAIVAGVIAVAIVVTYCMTTVLLMWVRVPADNNQLFAAAQTALVAMATGIIGFFYGRAHQAANSSAAPPAAPINAEVARDAGNGANTRSQP